MNKVDRKKQVWVVVQRLAGPTGRTTTREIAADIGISLSRDLTGALRGLVADGKIEIERGPDGGVYLVRPGYVSGRFARWVVDDLVRRIGDGYSEADLEIWLKEQVPKKTARVLMIEAQRRIALSGSGSDARGRQVAAASVEDDICRLAAHERTLQEGRTSRQVATLVARERLFLERFEEIGSRILSNRLVIRPPAPSKVRAEERIANVLLSDLHFRSMLDPREVPAAYGPHEEARRLAAVVQKVIEFKRPHRAETTLAVHLAGDIVQGQLHDMRDGAPMAEQCVVALDLLRQAIAHWAAAFPRVVVRCTPGNHGRNTARHPGRAVNQKWDGFEMIIYWALQMCLVGVPNVTFHPETGGKIPLTPYYTFDAFGRRGLVTHGDTVIQPGSPYRSIDTARISSQVQAWNAAEARAGRGPLSLFAMGHVHAPTVARVSGSGEWFITNGALVPADAFALSHGSAGTLGTQQLWESTAGYIFGDYRPLDVDVDVDRDETLERIIRPCEM